MLKAKGPFALLKLTVPALKHICIRAALKDKAKIKFRKQALFYIFTDLWRVWITKKDWIL